MRPVPLPMRPSADRRTVWGMPATGPLPPLRVLIADPHLAFRSAARALLRTEGLDVVADLGHDERVVELVTTLRPDVALIDVSPYRSDGLELARRVAALPHPPAVVLMSSARADTLAPAVDGAAACVPKAGLTAAAIARAAALAEQAPLRVQPQTSSDWSTVR